jgi:PST family polysaccharide transporter
MSAWNLVLQTLWFVILVPALTVGAMVGGVRGVAVAHAMVALLVVAPAFLFALRKGCVPLGPFLALSIRPVVAGVLVVLLGLAVLRLIENPFPQLMIGATVSGLAAAAVLVKMMPLARGVAEAD